MTKITSYGLGVYKIEPVIFPGETPPAVQVRDVQACFTGYFEYVRGTCPYSVIIMTEYGHEPCSMELSQFEDDEEEIVRAVSTSGSLGFKTRVQDLIVALSASRQVTS